MTPRRFPSDFELLLASQSPRRRELLSALGIPHRVVGSAAEEATVGREPARMAEANALAKAREALVSHPPSASPFVLGTDTVVVVAGEVLGKPGDVADARRMLKLLSGRSHEVISGVALLRGLERSAVGSATTRVTFRSLEEADLDAYLAAGEWEGKAGAYAIQGIASLFVEGIEGEYANVVGLPVGLLARLFRELGFDLLRACWL